MVEVLVEGGSSWLHTAANLPSQIDVGFGVHLTLTLLT